MSTEGGTKAVIAAASANIGIAIAKLAAWAVTGASSMLAEAIHSFADTGNQVLLLLGGRLSRKQATDEHPFGYGRERYLTAFMVSIVLFSMGGLFALYEAYHKFHEVQAGHPDQLLESKWWWVPLAVLGAAIVMEGLSFRTALVESNKTRGSLSLFRFIRAAKAPELPVILLEDFAALLGLVFALAGVGLTLLTHNGIFDVIGTAMIGLLLVSVAIVLAVETKSLLIGESASLEEQRKIADAIEGSEGIERLIHMKTVHLGPEEILVAAKISVNPAETGEHVAAAIDAAERSVRAAVPSVGPMYLEPDVYRPDHVPDPRPEPPAPPSH